MKNRKSGNPRRPAAKKTGRSRLTHAGKPSPAAKALPIRPRQERKNTRRPASMRILLIDDNAQDRALAERELIRQIPDLTVCGVGSEAEYADALKIKAYDLIITDYRLPWTDGLAVFRRVHQQYPECPVILYTGAGPEAIAAGLHAGMDYCVPKSIDGLSHLMLSIQRILDRKRSRGDSLTALDDFPRFWKTLPIGILWLDSSGAVLKASSNMLDLLGYSERESLLALKPIDWFESNSAWENFSEALKNRKSLEGYDIPLRRKDGTMRWCRLFTRPMPGPQGEKILYEVVVEDIQARKDVEKNHGEKLTELLRSNESLRAILEAVPTPIIGLDNKGNIDYVCNPAAERLLGKSRDEVLGRNLLDLVPQMAKHPEKFHFALEHPSAIPNNIIAFSSPNRPTVHLNLSACPLRDSDGVNAGMIVALSDVSDRKEADETLRLLNLVYDSVSNMLMLLRVESRGTLHVVKVNRAVAETTGRAPESLVGKTPQDFLSETVQGIILPHIRQVIQSHSHQSFFLSTRPPGRPRLSMEVTLTPILDSRSETEYIMVVARDITARLRSEYEIHLALHDLRESEHRYRALAEATQDLIFVLNHDLKVEYVNAVSLSMFHRAPAEILGRPMRNFFPPSIAERQEATLLEVLARGESAYRESFSQIGKQELWLGTWLIPLRNTEGAITSIMGVARDITERVQSEKALRESEGEYRNLVETSPDAILLQGSDTRITYSNQRALEVLGYPSVGALIGKRTVNMVLPEERDRLRSHWELLLQNGALRNVVYTIVREDGSTVPVELNASVIPGGDGKAKSVIVILRDITERRKRERNLLESEARFRAIFEKAAIGILLIGLDGRLMECNQALCSILDLPHEDLIRQFLEDIIHPEDRPAMQSLFQEILHGSQDHFHVELRLIPRNRGAIGCRLTVSTVRDPRGEFHFLIGMVEDISKQLEMEQASRQAGETLRNYADRLETLHEIDRAIQEAQSPEEIAHAALEQMHKLVPCQRSDLILFDFPARTLTILDTRSSIKSQLEKGKVIPLEDQGPELSILQSGKLIAVDDLLNTEKHTAIDQILLSEGIRTYLCIPLLAQGALIGILNIASGVPAAFTREHAEIASEVGDLLSVAIQQSRLFHQVRRHTIELESIAALNQDLRLSPGRAEIQEAILRHTAKMLDCTLVALLDWDPVSQTYLAERTTPPLSFLAGKRISPTDGFLANLLPADQPVPESGSRPPADSDFAEFLKTLKATACTSMVLRGYTSGILWIGRSLQEAGGDFNGDDLRLLVSLGDITGSALYRVSLYEQTERRLQRLSALRTVDMAISASIDLRVTLSILLDQVTNQLQADAAVVRIFNPNTHSLSFIAGRGVHNPAISQDSLPLGQGYAGVAAMERRMIRISDLRTQTDDYARILREGPERFISYFAAPLVAKGQMKGVLELFLGRVFEPDEEWIDFLETAAAQAAIAVESSSMFEDLLRTNAYLVTAYDETIEGWSRMLDFRDREAQGHNLRVADITIRLARLMGIPEENLIHIRRGALIHDIGKMAISDAILQKTESLTPEETRILQHHPVFAYEMLNPIRYLRPALDIPYFHHEKWDGTGYPGGLSGDKIPLAARLFAVTDVWDTLCNGRPYPEVRSDGKTRQYLQEQSGKHFDPAVVEAFFTLLDRDFN
jgi:PAS domain S-box-containing protein